MSLSPSPFIFHERRATPGTTLLAVILVLSLGAGIGLSPQAAAQVPVGGADLSGVVSDTSGHPIQDVTVTAKKQITGSTWSYHETRTDASGLWAFEGLDGGTWNLSFQKDGYRTLHEEIELQLNTSEEHDASLQSILESNLRGTVYESETGGTLAGAKIRVSTWDKESPEQRNTSSDENGEYEIPLFPGENEVMITKKGYSNERFWVYGGQGDVTREAWLWPTPPKDSVIEGRVVDAETGEGVQAYVSIRPDYDRVHHTDSGGSGTTTATHDMAVEPAYSPRYHHNNHNSTVTDEDGRFRMDAHAGPVIVEANREGYLVARTSVELEEGSTTDTELGLEGLPERSVTLSGVVKNAKNGSILPGASVSVQVPEAGDHQWTNADKDGRFEVQLRPGYTVIEVHYWGGHHPVEEPEAVAYDEAGSGGGEDAPASSESVESEPADPAPARDETRYYPAVRSVVTQANSDQSLEIELHPEREATTTIVGYVLDAETNEAVAGAHVDVHNHETSAWGRATTDEHGSFRFETHGGYHTLRAYRDGYLYAPVNTVAGDSGTHRVDIEIREGQWVDAGWWSPDDGRDDHRYGGGPQPMPMYEQEASGDAAMDRSSGGMSRAPSMMGGGDGGSAGLQGGPGGLGPYQGPEQGEAPAPGVFLVLLVGTLVLAGFRGRRNR